MTCPRRVRVLRHDSTAQSFQFSGCETRLGGINSYHSQDVLSKQAIGQNDHNEGEHYALAYANTVVVDNAEKRRELSFRYA